MVLSKLVTLHASNCVPGLAKPEIFKAVPAGSFGAESRPAASVPFTLSGLGVSKRLANSSDSTWTVNRSLALLRVPFTVSLKSALCLTLIPSETDTL